MPDPTPVWRHDFDGWSWSHFDLADPVLADWLETALDADIAAALTVAESRPRCTPHRDGLILILRGVNLNPGADPEDMVSLRLWVGPDRVVSARLRRIMTMQAIHDEITAGDHPETPDDLLVRIVRGLVARIEAVGLEFESAVDELEDRHLERGPLDVGEILSLRQALIKLRRFLAPQREALDTLSDVHRDTATAAAHRETAHRMARTLESLDAARDRLAVLGDHLLAEETARMGRNGYVLSVMAAIFLPLGFLTGLFGINVGGMPGIESSQGFLWVAGGSAVVGAALFALFKYLKWL